MQTFFRFLGTDEHRVKLAVLPNILRAEAADNPDTLQHFSLGALALAKVFSRGGYATPETPRLNWVESYFRHGSAQFEELQANPLEDFAGLVIDRRERMTFIRNLAIHTETLEGRSEKITPEILRFCRDNLMSLYENHLQAVRRDGTEMMSPEDLFLEYAAKEHLGDLNELEKQLEEFRTNGGDEMTHLDTWLKVTTLRTKRAATRERLHEFLKLINLDPSSLNRETGVREEAEDRGSIIKNVLDAARVSPIPMEYKIWERRSDRSRRVDTVNLLTYEFDPSRSGSESTRSDSGLSIIMTRGGGTQVMHDAVRNLKRSLAKGLNYVIESDADITAIRFPYRDLMDFMFGTYMARRAARRFAEGTSPADIQRYEEVEMGVLMEMHQTYLQNIQAFDLWDEGDEIDPEAYFSGRAN